jgi:hypothetical protein
MTRRASRRWAPALAFANLLLDGVRMVVQGAAEGEGAAAAVAVVAGTEAVVGKEAGEAGLKVAAEGGMVAAVAEVLVEAVRMAAAGDCRHCLLFL